MMLNIFFMIYWPFVLYSFNLFAHLLVGLPVILVFNFLSSLYILNINPLLDEFDEI
jgi:hypothetical protein